MKKLLFLLAVSLVSSTAIWAQGETVKVLYMSVLRTNGQEVSAPLYDEDSFIGPRVDMEERRLVIDGRSMLLSRIREIRFQVKTVDAIKTIEAVSTPAEDTPGNVYGIDGRLVRQNATSLEGLPKGIYIMNGKKYVIN